MISDKIYQYILIYHKEPTPLELYKFIKSQKIIEMINILKGK